VQKCPGKAVSLEVIVSPNFRLFDYHDPKAWEIFQTTPAAEFSRFLALAERGAPQELPPPRGAGGGGGAGAPGGPGRGAPNPEAQQRNLDDVEASVRWTQKFLATL